MFNNKQFREVILRPALNEINLYSESAEELLIAIMAHESKGGTYLEQVEGGPLGAHGIYQMETFTYDNIWNSYISQHPGLARLILNACQYLQKPTALHLTWNLKFATHIARVYFLRINEPLPATHDIEAMAAYWKKYWNTNAGKGMVDDFVNNYRRFINGDNASGKKTKSAA